MPDNMPIADLREFHSGYRGRQSAEILAAVCMIMFSIVLIFNEVVLFGKTLVPVNAAGVMGPTGPYGFKPSLRPDFYRPDTGASAWVSEPLSREVTSEYAAGRIPLWNSNQGFGSPLLANGQSGAIDIFRLPILVSDTALAWDFYYLLRAFVGGIVAYLLARLLGLVWAAGVFFAIAYVFSGHFLFYSNNTWIEAYFLLPVILAGTELVAINKMRLGFLTVALSVCTCLLVGMPEVALLVCLTSAGYGAYRLFIVDQPVQNWYSVRVKTAYIVGAWLVGIALAAPLLAPLFEFVRQSSSIATNRNTYGLYQEPLSEFITFLVPYIIGRPLEKDAGNLITTYVGTTAFVLALYGLSPTPTKPYRRIVPFWAFTTTLILAKIFGAPGINELGKLPLLNVTLILHWSAPLVCFGFALLAAYGVHRLVVEPSRSRAASFTIVIFVCLVLIGVYVNLGKLAQQTTEHYQETVGVALGFAFCAWALIQLRRRLAGTAIGFACCVTVVVELFIYAPHGVYQDRYDPFIEAPYIRFLRSTMNSGPFRIFGADGVMYPNFSSAFGLEDIRSLDALYLDRYLTYVRTFLAPGVTDRYVGASFGSSEQPTLIRDNPWFDLAGVLYIVTSRGSPTGSMFRGGLVERIVADDAKTGICPGRGRPCVSVEPITIDGITKPMLNEHPPSATTFRVSISPTQDDLRFSVALNPLVWDPSKGDGVGFAVHVLSGGSEEEVFRKEIDPKNNPADQHWIDGHVDLSRFDGKEISVILMTDPLKSSTADWAGWGDIRLGGSSSAGGQTYPLIYQNEVEIYQNTLAFSRAFLVTSVRPVATTDLAIAEMKNGSVDPSKVAIVEGLFDGTVPTLGSATGAVRISHYDSANAILDVNSDGPSYLVFTKSFFPGWYAYIDERRIPIYPTDLAFQGVFVPPGHSVVSFSYVPRLFYAGLGTALVSLLILIAVSTGVPQGWFSARQTGNIK